ncbi:MAG: RNA methyltransferase [Candidatus Geothermincolales bacterium]
MERRRGSDGVRITGEISSPRNEKLKALRQLRKRTYRKRERKFLVEGLKGVEEALKSENPPHLIACTKQGLERLELLSQLVEARRTPVYLLTEEAMLSVTTTVTPPGILAVTSFMDQSLGQLLEFEPSIILFADRVRDPGNMGNLIRIADAAGIGGVVVGKESVDIYNPKTVRSSAGSIFHVPHCVDVSLEECAPLLKERGYSLLVADPHKGVSYWETEWPERTVLVVGNEAWGYPEEEFIPADGYVSVPIFGKAESLNVSVAAALIIYEAKRRGTRSLEVKER